MSAFCSGCGAPLNGSKFCVKCGKQADAPAAPPAGGGYVPPAGGGYTPPTGGGYTPPTGGGYTPPTGGGYRPAGVPMNINYKLISVVLFWVGVLALAIGALIQFITGMSNIGNFASNLKAWNFSGVWVLPQIIIALFGAVATAVVVWKRNHPLKHIIGAVAGGAMIVLFIVLYIIEQSTVKAAMVSMYDTSSINGFTLLCSFSVKNMAAMVTFFAIGAASFIGSMFTERM